jgi:hypothetical protein
MLMIGLNIKLKDKTWKVRIHFSPIFRKSVLDLATDSPGFPLPCISLESFLFIG